MFAVCREKLGQDHVDVDLVGDHPTVSDLKAALAASHPELAPLLPIVRIAVNHAFAGADDAVAEQDELALIPPVSGGSGGGPFRVQAEPVTTEAVEAAVRHGGAGAVVSFLGTVRDHTQDHQVTALEYEAYQEMAERFLKTIGTETMARWPKTRVAILHRTGRLEIGEASVAIAVSSPHRADAFEACRHVIERLKQDVPIWKREIRTDGSVWVGVGS